MYFNHDPADLLSRLLSVMENDVIPLTTRGVAEGNKVFGAALLRKSDLSLVLAETNNETENPLWHGEIHTLKRFYEMGERPDTSALNKYLQSWDVPNVFVMGASAFPQNFAYNPTGTVGALAYWSAHAIREQYLKNPGPLVAA